MKISKYAFLATSAVAIFAGSGCSSNTVKPSVAQSSDDTENLLFANFHKDSSNKRIRKASAQSGYTIRKAAWHGGNQKSGFSTSQQQPAQVDPDFDTWDRVFQGFRLGDHAKNPRVDAFVNYYGRHPEKLTMLSERASVFLHMIVHELDRRNMPTELALLPFVESAFDPDVFSHAGAAGLWQFIPSTGQIYGLKQSRQYDARLDPFAATNAALDYLQKLHNDFNGDWLLALAAYNCGEGRVQKEIDRNRSKGLPVSFWHLSSLPRETREYVPRLLAFKELIGHAPRYGIQLPNTPNQARLAFLRVSKPVNLREVAVKAGLSRDQLVNLNPGFRTGITTPQYSDRIIIPRQHAQALIAAVDSLPAASSGNTDLANKSASGYNKVATARTSSKKATYAANKRKVHTVRKGDTLHTIAKRHGISVQALMKQNHKRSANILVGERLNIVA
ncbi:MAG: transglycosylase SLT domain-containing protein [Gammaproteobacteria bacterium]|nr:transglycosylase SLT domain-containing protein [Gammaproteobacteria bacterium]MBU1723095.1 transglycosylase SLT domain-containing protein [Gammaproteobacteria bacterium]MBU2007396.1 transglycosylase SLT domain-containing protein [Gammaproteobacteria bacterium]